MTKELRILILEAPEFDEHYFSVTTDGQWHFFSTLPVGIRDLHSRLHKYDYFGFTVSNERILFALLLEFTSVGDDVVSYTWIVTEQVLVAESYQLHHFCESRNYIILYKGLFRDFHTATDLLSLKGIRPKSTRFVTMSIFLHSFFAFERSV